MPRQRIHHSRRTHDFPDDFPERLVRFQEESKPESTEGQEWTA